jgi:hypothetical protein
MKLSDIVSALHLPIFAEVPLLVFMGIFIGVALHLLGSKEQQLLLGSLPLRDEQAKRRSSP